MTSMKSPAPPVIIPAVLDATLTTLGFTAAYQSPWGTELIRNYTAPNSSYFLSARISSGRISLKWNATDIEQAFPTHSWTFDATDFDAAIIPAIEAAFRHRVAIVNSLCERIPTLTITDLENPVIIDGHDFDYTLSEVLTHLINTPVYASTDCPFGMLCTKHPDTAISAVLDMTPQVPCGQVTVEVVHYDPDTADVSTTMLSITPEGHTWRSIYKASSDLLDHAEKIKGQIWHEGITIENGIYTLNYGT